MREHTYRKVCEIKSVFSLNPIMTWNKPGILKGSGRGQKGKDSYQPKRSWTPLYNTRQCSVNQDVSWKEENLPVDRRLAVGASLYLGVAFHYYSAPLQVFLLCVSSATSTHSYCITARAEAYTHRRLGGSQSPGSSLAMITQPRVDRRLASQSLQSIVLV